MSALRPVSCSRRSRPRKSSQALRIGRLRPFCVLSMHHVFWVLPHAVVHASKGNIMQFCSTLTMSTWLNRELLDELIDTPQKKLLRAAYTVLRSKIEGLLMESEGRGGQPVSLHATHLARNMALKARHALSCASMSIQAFLLMFSTGRFQGPEFAAVQRRTAGSWKPNCWRRKQPPRSQVRVKTGKRKRNSRLAGPSRQPSWNR